MLSIRVPGPGRVSLYWAPRLMHGRIGPLSLYVVLTAFAVGVIVMQGDAIGSAPEAGMALRFIGIDPDTGQQGSPTVWVDEENAELVFQGWKPEPDVEAACAATEVPGHAIGIPDNEAVVRIPVRMASMIREACDVAERRAQL